MRFLDDNIKIKIINKQNNRELLFKAYLEKSDVTFQVQETNLEYAPIGFTNESVVTRVIYNLDLAFDVFSENRSEAIDNYEKLHELIASLKPKYTVIDDQILPDGLNLFGQIQIVFKGLPKLRKNSDIIDVNVKNFSYSINKDMGYIELPYDNEDRKSFRYFDSGMRLVPIAYKINLGGRIAVPFGDMAELVDESGGAFIPPAAGAGPAAAAAAARAAAAAAPAGSPAAVAAGEKAAEIELNIEKNKMINTLLPSQSEKTKVLLGLAQIFGNQNFRSTLSLADLNRSIILVKANLSIFDPTDFTKAASKDPSTGQKYDSSASEVTNQKHSRIIFQIKGP